MHERPGKNFLAQLKQRKVFRVAVAYVFVAWVVMQVGEVTFEALTLPPWSLTLLIVVIGLGFPIALVLSWAYEITPEGVRKDVDGEVSAPSSETKNVESSAPSIAVLPFDDLSAEGDQGYFCEGIAEEILNALCKIANLRVASRITAFQMSGNRFDVKEIGRILNVQSVLDGSVRKSGDLLRITVELVKTADGYHLWSRQYDRQLADIFEVQEDIADSVATALSVTLKRQPFSARQAVDPRAYDFFLRGQAYFAKHTRDDTIFARQMFEKALEVDPEYGRAWAGLAKTYGFEYLYFNSAEVSRDEAMRTSKKALEIAPDLAESHVSAGIAYCMVKDYRTSEAEFETAIELDPKNFDAWYFFARAKVHQGELERALKLFQQAARVRPEDFQSVLLQAQLYTSLGNEKRAMEVSRKGVERIRAVLELNPDDNRARNMGAFALLRLGQREEAEQWMEATLKRSPMDAMVHYNAACFYSLAGEVDRALDCLETCILTVGKVNREWLEQDSDLDNIRDHPRFAKIIAALT